MAVGDVIRVYDGLKPALVEVVWDGAYKHPRSFGHSVGLLCVSEVEEPGMPRRERMEEELKEAA